MNKWFLNFAIQPEKFFEKTSKIAFGDMPYLYGALFLYAFWIFWDRYERLALWLEFLPLWVIIIIFFISVNVYFYLGSFFYNLRIWIAWWTRDVALARKILIYSKVYVNIFFLLSIIIAAIYYVTWTYESMFEGILNTTFSYVFIIGTLVWYYHAIYISWRSVTRLSNVKKWRAWVLFLVLPILTLTVIIVWGFTSVLLSAELL